MVRSPYYKAKASIAKALKAAVLAAGYKAKGITESIDFSRGFGDMSSSISFRIAQEQKLNPKEVAEKIAKTFVAPPVCLSASAENGYVNFKLNRDEYAIETVKYALGFVSQVPVSTLGKKEKIIVEYPSVNPNKPWHLGHLKNAVLGDSIARIHNAAGYDVEREDFIEDLGMQVVESLWGYLNMNNDPKGKKFDQWLGEEYVKVNQFMESNDIKEQLSRLLQSMEKPATKEAQLAREISEKCVRAQNETAFSYGIFRDILVWETDIMERIYENGIGELLKMGIAEKITSGEYENCIVMDLSKAKKLPKEFRGLKEKIKVLVRKDGTPTYVAKDIVFHMWKFALIPNSFSYTKFIEQPSGRILYTTTHGEGSANVQFGSVKKAVNIIDARQDYPQGLLRLAFSSMGREDVAKGIMHLSYGALELEEGVSLSGRKGNWLGNTADNLLAAAQVKAMETLSESRFKLPEEEQKKAALKIAIGAIKFDLLKQAPEKKTIFSWARALNFEGNSGPYCQYMYARALRLMETAKIKNPKPPKTGSWLQIGDHEFALVKLISKLPYVVEKSCMELRPNVIAEYANDLSSTFSKFYENVPVLKDTTEEQKNARIALAAAFMNSIGYALDLLGIPTVERM
jgi:arginyl-tRNA synthetase